ALHPRILPDRRVRPGRPHHAQDRRARSRRRYRRAHRDLPERPRSLFPGAVMADPADIANALRGAWRLAHFDPSGVAFFGHDERAFWRSFIAALIAFPAFLLFLPLGSDADAAPTDWVRVLLVETIAYVIGWTAFPLVVLPVTRFLGREA